MFNLYLWVLKSFCFNFDLTLASVLKSVMKCFLKTLFEKECKCKKDFVFLREQVSKNHLPTRKRNRSMLFSFRQYYPTIDE